MKEHVLSFPKMWYFLGVRLFKGELLAVKEESSFKKTMVGEGGVTKKSHGHNFDFSGLKRIAGLVHPISYTTYSFQDRVFFWPSKKNKKLLDFGSQ